jgi:hypothetical protein
LALVQKGLQDRREIEGGTEKWGAKEAHCPRLEKSMSWPGPFPRFPSGHMIASDPYRAVLRIWAGDRCCSLTGLAS